MEITISNGSIKVDKVVCAITQASYLYSTDNTFVVIYLKPNITKKAHVKAITVNGVQMTTENIDELLAPLFLLENEANGDSGNANTPSVDNAFTQTEWSDPLVYPAPLRSGHVVEFYKDQQLYQSYQWTGFSWDLIGMKANLVYVLADSDSVPNMQVETTVLSSYCEQDKLYVSVKEGQNFFPTVVTTQLLTVDKTYIIDMLRYYVLPDQQHCILQNATLRYVDLVEKGQNTDTTYACQVLIKDCQLNYLNSQMRLDKIQLEDCQPLPNQTQIDYINLSAAQVCIERSELNNSSIYLVKPSSSTGDVSILLKDNHFSYGINIGYSYTSEQFNYDIRVCITGNSGLTYLSLSEIAYLGTITSLELDLDPSSLTRLDISDTAFSTDAQQVLIDALTAKNYTQPNRSFSAYGMNLTLEQKTALENAGWQVSS